MAEDGPPLLRPIPRRPFDMNLTSATPPSDTESSEPPPQDNDSARFLSAANSLLAGTPSMSRSSSAMNLASSTLYGIYSPTATGKNGVFEGDTPWGTGAQTPARRGSVDGLSRRGGAVLHRRRSSYRSVDSSTHSDPLHTLSPSSLLIRGIVLFSLGMGYGVLLARFQDSSPWYLSSKSFADNIIIKSSSADWKTLFFWGVAGVVWGAGMPWLDKLWYEAFGDDDAVVDEVETDLTASEGSGITTDWALVLRAIGAFVGIVFAIRKLAWTSTLQISLTLAMVNPLLWWLIDRSKVGILLSTTVGLVGSILLLGLDPDLMPVPPSSTLAAFTRGFNESLDDEASTPPHQDHHAAGAGLLANQELMETGIWMLSVLFCSCLCFGNIGRRMARDRMAVGRGRWGGVR